MIDLRKILVANRGEIACRVIRGAQALGYKAVAVYSDADAHARHVALADEAVGIGAAPASESYLAIDRILAAAQSTGAGAIHPGYGFLAENAEFARAVEEAGLVFVGPTADAIALMGDKRAAKQRMIAAGVPCTPGYEGDVQDDATLIEHAERIGLPVMVKASAGGGGRGMRRVDHAGDLKAAIQSARSEAKSAFGSDDLIFEKAVTGARHVEIQVLADQHGHVIHLGERDCSIQRRHQKVIEEAPSPAVDEALRARMGAAAVEAAATIGYRGAGTVEFLLDASGEFYFMEMNTRLQVEHPVTEYVTGLDLVAWQLRIAAGEPLSIAQEDVVLNGHAIEARLCLEDVAADFLPQTGTVRRWRVPEGPGIRVDHGLQGRDVVTPHYDSLVAKLIAYGPTREIARTRLINALTDTVLFGPVSNRDFLGRVVAHPVFASGDFDIGFIAEHGESVMGHTAPSVAHRALAAVLFHADAGQTLAGRAGLSESLRGWRSAYANESPVMLGYDDQQEPLRLRDEGTGRYQVQIEDAWHPLRVVRLDAGRATVEYDGVMKQADYLRDGNSLWLSADGQTVVYSDIYRQPPAAADASGDGVIVAPIDGRVQRVDVAAGDTVSVGDTLVVLEAMKMEFTLSADIEGVVDSVDCEAGAQVAAHQRLVLITAPENDNE